MDFADCEGTAGVSAYHLGGDENTRYSMTVANAGDHGRHRQLERTMSFTARGRDMCVCRGTDEDRRLH